jgi:hypothetical protein
MAGIGDFKALLRDLVFVFIIIYSSKYSAGGYRVKRAKKKAKIITTAQCRNYEKYGT